MPTIKAVSAYPSTYWMLFRRGSYTVVKVPCANRATAKNLRKDLYNFRTAIRKQAEVVENETMQFSTLCDSVLITIQSNDIILLPRDDVELYSEVTSANYDYNNA